MSADGDSGFGGYHQAILGGVHRHLVSEELLPRPVSDCSQSCHRAADVLGPMHYKI